MRNHHALSKLWLQELWLLIFQAIGLSDQFHYPINSQHRSRQGRRCVSRTSSSGGVVLSSGTTGEILRESRCARCLTWKPQTRTRIGSGGIVQGESHGISVSLAGSIMCGIMRRQRERRGEKARCEEERRAEGSEERKRERQRLSEERTKGAGRGGGKGGAGG